MGWFAWCAGYLAGHLGLYFLVLRHRPAFAREATIFLYHAVSALGTALLMVLALLLAPDRTVDLETAAGVVALHGIYSVSFLELWSLAEGGYSLAIMDYVERSRAQNGSVDLRALHRIGRAKQMNRLEGIGRLGLIRRRDGSISLTSFGRVVAWLLAAIAWAANIRVRG